MSEQQTIDNVYTDWLGNQISVGDWVLYSSKSTNSGMNLGKVEYVGPSRNPNSRRHIIQVKVWNQTGRARSTSRTVTLSSGDGAYMSVTKYPGSLSWFESND